MEACHAEYQYRLSICAIFQNEAPYLKEWIEFHKLVGVEHFYLYNHRSQDNYEEVLKPYLLSGLVELMHEPTQAHAIEAFNPLQCKCYTHCLAYSRGISQWIAFLDIDEFLFPINEHSLPEVLKSYEAYGGVCVNWLIFGTSFIKKIPENHLLIESLIRCSSTSFPPNTHVKSIVRPERASHFVNPHHPIYLKEYFQVNTDKLPFEGRFSPYIRTNKLRINHYWTRDEEFFYHIKIPRQQRWGGAPNSQKILQEMNAQKDEVVIKYVPALKKALGLN